MVNVIGGLHNNLVFQRRTSVLARELAAVLPRDTGSILDVGCGDGLIDTLIQKQFPGVTLTGVDIAARPNPHIPVSEFDGIHLPFEDKSFDVVMFVDVLHHTDDPGILLREAKRVARKAVVLKDHTMDSALAGPTLRVMDWVGNAHHGVVLPYNYWSTQKWRNAFAEIGLRPQQWNVELGLYPFPVSLMFERNLHFVACLAVDDEAAGQDKNSQMAAAA
jgi:SAM-dependent methyltransferase